jgi:hypothetical protein
LNLARRAKRDLPDDLTAKGTISASFHARRMTTAPSDWIGNLVLSGLVIHSAVLGKDLEVSKAVAMVNTVAEPEPRHRGHGSKVALPASPIRALVIQSFNLPLGASTPAAVDGQLDDDHFALHIRGDATLERLQQFARAVGIGAPKIALAGPSVIDLVIGGHWTAFESPEVTGTAQLRNVRAEVPGLSVPVEIASAHIELDRNRFAMRNASATVGKIAFSGSASFPRFCNADTPCESSFDLTTDDLNPDRWNDVLNPNLKKKPWYRLFGSGESERNLIVNLHSTGHLSARHLTLATTAGSGLETDFTIADGVLRLKNTRAELLGGTVSGDWKIDYTASQPKYESTGTATRIQAEKLGALLKSPLGSGTIGLKYKLEMSGLDASTLARSALAETDFTWSGGALRLSSDGKPPMRVQSGEGKATLNKDGWTISASKWQTPTGLYQLTGTASRDMALALVFAQENGTVLKVTGTLPKPQLTTSAPQLTQVRH